MLPWRAPWSRGAIVWQSPGGSGPQEEGRQGAWAGGHAPYALTEVRLNQWDALPLRWDGFSLPDRPPDHVGGARGVEVRVGALERL